MAAEVLTHQHIPSSKPDDSASQVAGNANPAKRNYVPIRPAYRPLLPKPSAKDNTPSPIHIHTRTSGSSQLGFRKRHSAIGAKLDSSKRRRNLQTRAPDQPPLAHAYGAAAEPKAEMRPSPLLDGSMPLSARESPSPASSLGGSPANITSVSTRSIFGPPPEGLDGLDDLSAFEAAEPAKMRGGVSSNMTSMMSALANRMSPAQPAVDAASLGTSPSSIDEASASSVFAQLSLDRYEDLTLEPLDLEQLSKIDLELDPAAGSPAGTVPSLSSSAATTASIATADSLATIASSAVPDIVKNMGSQSPEPFTGYASPSAEFDEFTDLYFRTGAQSNSVSPDTDHSPQSLDDMLDNESSFIGIGKGVQDEDLTMLDFLSPAVDML